MAMEHNWYDLIPFYVARTLPQDTMQAFEMALTHDDTLRREVQEWRIIASAVWLDTDVVAKQLPPLKPDIYEKLAYRRPLAGTTDSAPIPDYAAHPSARRGRAPRRIQIPLTMVAGLVGVLVCGALLILAASNRDNPLQVASAATVTMTVTPSGAINVAAAATLTAEQVMTQLAGGTVNPPFFPPTVTPSIIQAVQPTASPLPPITRTPLPTPNQADLPLPSPNPEIMSMTGLQATPTLYVPAGLPDCRVTNVTTAAINIYDVARRTGSVLGQMNPGESRVVFQTTLDNWYNILTPDGRLQGWVTFEDVSLSGDCLNLPQPSPTALPTSTVVLTPVSPETFVTVTAVFADVRSGPGVEFPVMMAVPRNDSFRVLGITGSNDYLWYYVVLADNQQGWLWNQQVTLASEVVTRTPTFTPTPLFTPSPVGQ